MSGLGRLGVVHAIAHALRYRPLPELVGRRVVVDGLDSFEAAARELAGVAAGNGRFPRDERSLRISLAKYAAVDLLVEIPASKLPPVQPRASLELLRAYEFVGEDAKALFELFGENDELAATLDELRSGNAWTELLLRTSQPYALHERAQIVRHGASLPDDYFPREFEVVDACVTNYASIWVWKHFMF